MTSIHTLQSAAALLHSASPPPSARGGADFHDIFDSIAAHFARYAMGTANPDPEPEAPMLEDSDGQGEVGPTPDEENNASGQDSAMPATPLAINVPWPSAGAMRDFG